MKTSEDQFIQQSATGRNPWWAYVGIILSSLTAIIIINQLVNRLVMPLVKDTAFLEVIGKDNFTYLLIGFVFGSLLLILKIGHKKFHLRPFAELINTTTKSFRWGLYLKGMYQWGILLMVAQLITQYTLFQNFLDKSKWSTFWTAALLSAGALFIQTLWEELLFRGYLLQNLGRKFSSIWIPNFIIAMLFGLAHFGYGFESLITSFVFSVFMVLITLKDQGIERAAGIHFINNFLLLTFFVEIKEVTNSTFSWSIEWLDLGLFFISVAVILIWSKVIELNKK
jgi:uncharacterized protein